MKIACIGAGAIGAHAALLTAQAVPQATITVFDAGLPTPGDRTFVLAGGTRDRLQESGIWTGVDVVSHPLRQVKSDFAGCFGALTLSSSDCQTESFAQSIAERDLLQQIRQNFSSHANIKLCAPAQVTGLERSGQVQWRANEQDQSEQFDLVLATGLAEHLLQAAGVVFTSKNYDQLALVTTLAGPPPSDTAHERLLATGAATLVPRRDGWGHILLLEPAAAQVLQQLADDDFIHELRQRNWLPLTGEIAVHSRGCFPPRQRLAQFSGMPGRIVLLGPCACTVNPVGAQELNLGLRDVLALAQLLGDGHNPALLAAEFELQRASDRHQVARMTDLAARLVRCAVPGKLPLLGLAATAIDLCPPARRWTLGAAVYRNG